MVTAAGVRIEWVDLPARVRAAVAEILGSRVVEAVSQPGGFSPGTADRVRTADGRRAFVKAVSAAQNEHSPRMHRAEAHITAALPATAPTPTLLGAYDDGDWVALVLTDVDGRHPATPWRADELALVRAALTDLARQLTPTPVEDAPNARDHLEADFTGWHRLRADAAPLDPWAAAHLDELCAHAEHGLAALTGDTLVHTDIRADNLLLGADGTVTVVDWPSACRGPAWLDTLLLLVNVRLYGGLTHGDSASAAGAHRASAPGGRGLTASASGDRAPVGRASGGLASGGLVELDTIDADRTDLVGALAGVGGYFADAARHLAPPGMPTVRAFQRAQADAVVSWLRQLIG